MVSAIWVVIAAIVAAVVGYLLGESVGYRWEPDPEPHFLPATTVSVPAFSVADVRHAAFSRAALAVGLHQGRIDRRGELVQHLLSLADAPDVSAPLADEGEGDTTAPFGDQQPAQFVAGEESLR